MKTWLLMVLFLCAFSFVGNAQTPPDCKKFLNGKFEYPNMPGYYETRKGKLQKGGAEGELDMVWGVKWLNECTYELSFKKLYNPKFNNFKKGDRILVTINETEGDCYTFSLMYYTLENPKGRGPQISTMCLAKEQ